ncbi:MAG TPA: YfiR/HmsC family protein [Candidatus Ozemobacteraceae bacterium]|nr:YfiR/HmsC family protein [Candidatus Ozemobacteraceae bacterium]
MALLPCSGAAAERGERRDIPIPLQIQIFLKIITYDRSFDNGTPAPYQVGVVLRNMEEPSDERIFRQVSDALSKKTILGRPLVPVKLLFRKGQLSPSEPLPDMLVLIGNWEEDGDKVAEFARKHHRLTFGSDVALLESGVAVVMSLEGSRPVIHVNLTEAKAGGADFHANFLKHCRVIR